MTDQQALIARYLNRRETGASREVVTPEGVPLRFGVALVGQRMSAVMLDYLRVLGLTLAVTLPMGLLAGAGLARGYFGAFALLALFLFRNFYFVWFEIRWQGATPGKRRAGLRVIDRRGGPLTAGAVFARNVTREFEVVLPLLLLIAPEQFLSGAPGAATLLALVWVVVVALLPLFNRERLRVGDLLAGTVVVQAPREHLERELSKSEAAHTFTTEQLDVYGIYELQVLEDLLRGRVAGKDRALRAVADRIRKKIGWKAPGRARIDSRLFLEDFYAAQRARLEQRMLLGERRERKRN